MSNTIAQNLAAIKNIKDNLRIQINAKGVPLSASAPFSAYPTAVASIPSEGGGDSGFLNIENVSRVVSETAQVCFTEADNVTRAVSSEYKCNIFTLNSGLTLNGELLINADFSTASGNYVVSNSTLPLSTADSWEFQTAYTFLEGNSDKAILGFSGSGTADGPELSVYSDNTLFFGISSDGNSRDIVDSSLSYNFVTGIQYYIKIGFTGSSYYCKINTSGWDSQFETLEEISDTTKCYCSQPFMLMNSGDATSSYNPGIMDLSQTKWIINGSDYLVCGTLTTSTL